jgi:hypothetical protein
VVRKSFGLFVVALALGLRVGAAVASPALDQDYEPVTLGFLPDGGGFTYGSEFRRAETFTVGISGTLTSVEILLNPSIHPYTFTGFNILSTVGGVPASVIATGTFEQIANNFATFATSLPVTVGEVLALEPIASAFQSDWASNLAGGYAGAVIIS